MSYPDGMVETPVHFPKALRLYEAMDAQAHTEEVDELPVRVWRGGMMELYKSVRPGLSMAYYSRLTRGLKHCGCVTMLQKGGRNTETIYALHHPPTAEQWIAYERSPLTKQMESRRLQEQVADLRKEVEQLRTRQQQIVDHLGLPADDPPAEASEDQTATQ